MAATKQKTKKSTRFELRTRRVFSEAFKREKVAEITSGRITIRQLSEVWQVHPSAIYLWLYKYSPAHQKGAVMVIQKYST